MLRLTLKDGTKVVVTPEQSKAYYRDIDNYIVQFEWLPSPDDVAMLKQIVGSEGQ